MMTTVGKSVPHDSARGHVTGTARYIDDYVPVANELVVDFVGSPVAAGTIESIELAAARRVQGVVGIYTAVDLDGHNRFGGIISDEPFLAEQDVAYVGQPTVVIAAESWAAAKEARKLVRIQVRPKKPIFSIDDAVAAGEQLGSSRQIKRGNFASAFASSPHQLTGRLETGGQEQFYLESQAAIAYPEDNGRLTIHSSTQNPTEIQAVVAEVLGMGQQEVVCVCKRMGGAFGGKESQATIPALMAALVTKMTGRAARVVWNKDDDMKVTGKRHPYRCDYQVGFDDEGRLLAVQFNYYSNGGAFADLSTAVMERTMLHSDNAYFIPNVEINARVCRTNYPPNTAFRGFGGPQGMATVENIIQDIAVVLGRDAYDVRRINCYGTVDRNVTPYGQTVERNLLPEIFDSLLASSDYRARAERIVEFNQQSTTHLHGIAMTPVKFGISFTTKFLNQGNALVNVYTDGGIQVSTGATEMGQGVNTKIRQLVADQFGLPIERVQVMDTSTEKNNNTSPTAASAGTDLNGSAAVQACVRIRERLTEFAATELKAASHDIRFEAGDVFDVQRPAVRIAFGQLAADARRARVDLGERAFYATPIGGFDRETGQGSPFFYFTTGCAVAEVEIDRFTGELKVERVDLRMDIGNRINPGIDRGQVIGGFIQGMGYVTNECLRYDDDGRLLSHSPTTYKIPNITDLPSTFHVDFVEHPNLQNVGHSKAVGEPPLMLALSVWAAVKHAVSQAGSRQPIQLALPATGEVILQALSREAEALAEHDRRSA